MRKFIAITAVGAAGVLAAIAVPGAGATQITTTTIPRTITVVPGACVTEPCALPIVVTVPDKP